jgi:hypothetical protein
VTFRFWKWALTEKIDLYLGGARLNLGREMDYPEYIHGFPQIL